MTFYHLKLQSFTSSDLVFKNSVQGSLEETDQSDLIPGPGVRSQMLTDIDPVLGGMQELCDTAGETNLTDQIRLRSDLHSKCLLRQVR